MSYKKGKDVKKKAKGGGSDFGMLSVKAGIDKNPNATQADRIAGATMSKKRTAAMGGGMMRKTFSKGGGADRPGLYANIKAKKDRIKAGSGEKMKKPGAKGAPTAKNFRNAAKTAKKA